MANPIIAAIPGDGIGNEVVPAAVRVLDHAAASCGVVIDWRWFDWGCDYYVEHGSMMPESGISELATVDSIFLGAVGRPDVPDHISLWGLLIPIRREFDQYINLRPARLFDGITPKVVLPLGTTIDLVIVRENTEGEYSEIGGRFARGTDQEFALQENIFTRRGVTRVSQYALDLAQGRRKNLVSATKSNGILHTMPFWDEVVESVVSKAPEVAFRKVLIDALSAEIIENPQRFDVIVASNLFGDILSDIAAAMVGSLGIAPSGNINPERTSPSMFEPVHGSAPDIAGSGVANPIAAVWSGAMMMQHLGYCQIYESIMSSQAMLDRNIGLTHTYKLVNDRSVESKSNPDIVSGRTLIFRQQHPRNLARDDPNARRNDEDRPSSREHQRGERVHRL